MKIYLPNDAEGNVIPFDTECLYSYDGKKQDVLRFTYYKKQDKWEIETDLLIIDSTFLHLTPPDSWEKLEDDLDRCIKESNLCMYYNQNLDCNNCAISGNESRGCTSIALEDILLLALQDKGTASAKRRAGGKSMEQEM